MALQIHRVEYKRFFHAGDIVFLAQVSIFFDLLFMVQHYLLYPYKNEKLSLDADAAQDDNTAPLIKSSDPSQSENV